MIFVTRPLFTLPVSVSFDIASSFLWICSAVQHWHVFFSAQDRAGSPCQATAMSRLWNFRQESNTFLSRKTKLSVCENCVQPLGVYIQRSNIAQRFMVRSRGTSGVVVESLAQFRVKLALLWAEGSGTGKAMLKMTPMAKMITETKKMSPRRKMSWETESGAWGLVFEVFLLCSASPPAPPAFVLLPPASWTAFSSWSWVLTGL